MADLLNRLGIDTSDPAQVIDRLIVNGDVTRSGRVLARTLGCEAIAATYHTPAQLREVIELLRLDDRFAGTTKKGDVLLKPDAKMTPGSKVRPSLRAIINQSADCTPAEELAALRLMDIYSDIVYRFYPTYPLATPGIVPLRVMRATLMGSEDLKKAGMPMTHQEYGAFVLFVSRRNGLFYRLADQRVVFRKIFEGQLGQNINDIVLLQPITDVEAAIRSALDNVGPNTVVTENSIWFTLEQMGFFASREQRLEFDTHISAISGIKPTGLGKYLYMATEPEPLPPYRPQQALALSDYHNMGLYFPTDKPKKHKGRRRRR